MCPRAMAFLRFCCSNVGARSDKLEHTIIYMGNLLRTNVLNGKMFGMFVFGFINAMCVLLHNASADPLPHSYHARLPPNCTPHSTNVSKWHSVLVTIFNHLANKQIFVILPLAESK